MDHQYPIPSRPQNILVFCHLRWNFVYQRPQHLLSRCQKFGNVHLWEEPIYAQVNEPLLQRSVGQDGVTVITPMLPAGLSEETSVAAQRALLDTYLEENVFEDFVAWYYTPMALRFSDHLEPAVTVYDCMDELSAFDGASPELITEEHRLFARADVVFCGGASLYESKRKQHRNVHLFASSIDRKHFAAARTRLPDPQDQAAIPHPRIGFYGVLDERLDRDLLAEVARVRPHWHLVLLGPVVKISEADLPRAENLHYLGQKHYAELPAYLSNWEVAMLPFVRNASTRFISPTKTPEYLAGGKPVVSTPIADVVRFYGEGGYVTIARDAREFVASIEGMLSSSDSGWLAHVDAMLAGMSWDATFNGMWREVKRCSAALRVPAETMLTTGPGSEVNV